jgi:hypothetical protein
MTAATLSLFTAPEHCPRGCAHCGGMLFARTASEWSASVFCSPECAHEARVIEPDPTNPLLMYPELSLHGVAEDAELLEPGTSLSHLAIAELLELPEKQVRAIERGVLAKLAAMAKGFE